MLLYSIENKVNHRTPFNLYCFRTNFICRISWNNFPFVCRDFSLVFLWQRQVLAKPNGGWRSNMLANRVSKKERFLQSKPNKCWQCFVLLLYSIWRSQVLAKPDGGWRSQMLAKPVSKKERFWRSKPNKCWQCFVLLLYSIEN